MTIDEAIKHARDKSKVFRDFSHFEKDGYRYINLAEEQVQLAEWLEELKEYEELEEKGLLLKLPCKVGDTVYLIDRYVNSREWHLVYGEHRVTDILLNENREPKIRITNTYGSYELSDFGKTVFLTKEEAEQELKRLESAE